MHNKSDTTEVLHRINSGEHDQDILRWEYKKFFHFREAHLAGDNTMKICPFSLNNHKKLYHIKQGE